MGKNVPRGNNLARSGLGLNLKNLVGPFANVAALNAAGYTPAACPGGMFYLSAGGTGSVACMAVSDGTNWKQVAIGANCI